MIMVTLVAQSSKKVSHRFSIVATMLTKILSNLGSNMDIESELQNTSRDMKTYQGVQ